MEAQETGVETLTGTVVSQQANFYYVQVGDGEIACHLRGRLKKEGETPYVGDRVVVHLEPVVPGEKLPPPREGSLVLEEGEVVETLRKGAIDQIVPRKSLLKRPTIANVDQVLLVFAADSPPFNPFLLDKFLVLTQQSGFPVVIVINKRDLVPPEALAAIEDTYRQLGYTVVATQAAPGGVDELLPLLAHKTSVLAGPSGVGKSSLLNTIQPGLLLRTATVSDKLQRGRHTTRHAALFPIEAAEDALVADTPGFSYLGLEALDPAELAWFFPEMTPHIPACKMPSCLHVQEPHCAVRENANIGPERYESYIRLLEELRQLQKEAAERSSKVESGVKRHVGRQGQERRMVKVDAAEREPDRKVSRQKVDQWLSEAQEAEEDDWLEDEAGDEEE